MESVLNVLEGDAFSFVALTDSINKVPFAPNRATTVVDWNEESIPMTTIEIEQKANVIELINPSERGGPGGTREKVLRTVEIIKVPHYERNDGVNADEVQNVRAWGTGGQVETVTDKVNERMAIHALDFDATIEYQRLGAVKGIILDANGNERLNLFTKLAVTPQVELNFNLTSTADDGSLVATFDEMKRRIARALGGTPFTGIYGFASDSWWDALMKNTERRKTYQSQNAAALRDGSAWQTYAFGGVTIENYRGGVGDEESGAPDFIEDGKVYFFPVGVPRLFRTVFAPADYDDTVNTMGKPRYSRIFPWLNQKGFSLDVQTNSLSYCTRPRALQSGRIA